MKSALHWDIAERLSILLQLINEATGNMYLEELEVHTLK
jgi:hypothetical protein